MFTLGHELSACTKMKAELPLSEHLGTSVNLRPPLMEWLANKLNIRTYVEIGVTGVTDARPIKTNQPTRRPEKKVKLPAGRRWALCTGRWARWVWEKACRTAGGGSTWGPWDQASWCTSHRWVPGTMDICIGYRKSSVTKL